MLWPRSSGRDNCIMKSSHVHPPPQPAVWPHSQPLSLPQPERRWDKRSAVWCFYWPRVPKSPSGCQDSRQQQWESPIKCRQMPPRSFCCLTFIAGWMQVWCWLCWPVSLSVYILLSLRKSKTPLPSKVTVKMKDLESHPVINSHPHPPPLSHIYLCIYEHQ